MLNINISIIELKTTFTAFFFVVFIALHLVKLRKTNTFFKNVTNVDT